jgi:hypothetical protein
VRKCSHLAPRDESRHAERDAYTPKRWITDFGLARIEQDAGMTIAGAVGTQGDHYGEAIDVDAGGNKYAPP